MSAATTTRRSVVGDAPETRRPASRRRGGLPAAAMAALSVAVFIALMHAGRGTTFFFDEWNFVLDRRAWAPHALLSSHNEHFVLFPVLLYKLLFETVGLDSYWAFRAALAALDVLCGVLLFVYARPRVGGWAAVAVTGPLMLMGPSFWDVVWPFQITFLAPLGAGLGAFVCLDREDRLGDVLAFVLLGVALGSSSLGIFVLVGALFDVALRPRWRQRLWIVAVPAVLYGLWYLRYGHSTANLRNLPDAPGWVFDAADDAAAAAVGLPPAYGVLLIAGLAAVAVRRLIAPGRVDARLVALLAMPISFWAATALSRAGLGVSPGESRYLYPGALFLLLIAVELARGHHVRGRAAGLLVLAFAAGAIANYNSLPENSAQLRGRADATIASLAALEVAGPRVDPSTLPDASTPQLEAGPYFAAVRDYGSSPTYSPSELQRAPAAIRAGADGALLTIYGKRIGAADARSPRTAETAPQASATAGRTTDRRGCVAFTPTGGPRAELTVVVPPEGVLVRTSDGAPAEVRIRRFGDGFPAKATGEIAARSAATIGFPSDGSSLPWRLSLRSRSPLSACALA